MRYLLLVCFYCFSLSLKAQSKCAFNFDTLRIIPQGKSKTLKWSISPTPTKGYFNIYRKTLSSSVSTTLVVTSLSYTKKEFCDEDKSLSSSVKYEYRLELIVDNQKCSIRAEEPSRAIDDNDSFSMSSGKNINTFKQADVFEIIPVV